MISPFKSFSVQPFLGGGEAAVSWELAPGITGGVYIYRSLDGLQPWLLLNPGDPVVGTSSYLDITTPNADPLATVHYRGVVDPAGGAPDTWLAGPSVSPLDQMTRKEYLLACAILQREYNHMAGPAGNGLPVFHMIPKKGGEPARGYDPDTKQQLSPACPGEAESGYGLPWRGGFLPPLQTWALIMAMGDHKTIPKQDMRGEDWEAPIMLRLLAFPRPEPGHMLVFPGSDRRYVLDNEIKPFYLRGGIPLFWEAKALRLSRTDQRARVELPALIPDQAWRVQYRLD